MSNKLKADILKTIAEGAAGRDQNRHHPFDAIKLIKEARFGALRLPVSVGGRDATISELLDFVKDLGEADPNVAQILRNHFVFVERFARRPAGAFGLELQKKVAAGAIFGLAAGELGTRVSNASFQTVLEPREGGFSLNGSKYYSTGSLYADYVVIRAKLNDKIASVIVPRDRDGLELVDDWDAIGQRLTGSGTTRLNDVFVAAHEVVADEKSGYGLQHIEVLPNFYLTTITAGILRNLLTDAVKLIHSRKRTYYHAPSETPAHDPLLQQVIGRLSTWAFTADAVISNAADAISRSFEAADRGTPDPDLIHDASLRAAKAKVILDELAQKAGSLIFDAGGASAAHRDTNLDRHWRNARTLASHNPNIYKEQAIGDFEINGTRLPDAGFF